jgi:hypothetical protein
MDIMSELDQKEKLSCILAMVAEFNATFQINQNKIQTALNSIKDAQLDNEKAKEKLFDDIKNLIKNEDF